MTNGATFEERYLERARHELALELWRMRRMRHHWRRIDGARFDSNWYQGAIDAIVTLGYERFRRPGRRRYL